MRISQTRIALGLLAFLSLTTISGCSFVDRIRAKNQLNEGARAYKAGKFAEAQQHFQSAVELDSTQKDAPFFIARSLHAQYRPGVESPENVAKARDAIAAYQKVLDTNPENDEAYKAMVYLYGAIKEDVRQQQFLTQRASQSNVSGEKRADAFVVLASKQWKCSFDITEQKENKPTVQKDGKQIIQFRKPKEQSDFDKAQQCAQSGLQLAEQAIKLADNNESAWSYKTNLLREMSKLAEMENNTGRKEEYDAQAEEALKRHTELSEQNRRKKEEEEAKRERSARAS